jgi:hypothetical protein
MDVNYDADARVLRMMQMMTMTMMMSLRIMVMMMMVVVVVMMLLLVPLLLMLMVMMKRWRIWRKKKKRMIKMMMLRMDIVLIVPACVRMLLSTDSYLFDSGLKYRFHRVLGDNAPKHGQKASRDGGIYTNTSTCILYRWRDNLID